MPRVLITGVAGQDGIYLARHLLAQGCAVVGTLSPGFAGDDPRGVYLDGVETVRVDVRDGARLAQVVLDVAPDEVYNLAALSSVARSWEDPAGAMATNAAPVEHLAAALLRLRAEQGVEARLFQASSAEVGGAAAESPYARAKAAADDVVRRARDDHGLFAVCGVLHNHESPLRSPQFVTRKITRGVAEIALGRRTSITLGNLEVHRDWGNARDYVEAMRLQLAHDVPLDLPIGTGRLHALSDLVDLAFKAAGLGAAAGHVEQDPSLLRPVDAQALVADPEPAARALGWRATTTFEETIEAMVRTDLDRLRSGREESPDYLRP